MGSARTDVPQPRVFHPMGRVVNSLGDPSMQKFLVISALAAVAIGQCFAQSKIPTLIQIEHAREHIGEQVRIDGVIGKKLLNPANNTDVNDVTVEFKLEGSTEFNNTILVRTQMRYPTYGTHYRFLGHLSLRSYLGVDYAELTEEKGWPMNKLNPEDPDRTVTCDQDNECSGPMPTSQAAGPKGVVEPVPSKGMDPIVMGLLIATGVIVLALFAVLIRVLSSGSKNAPAPASAPIVGFTSDAGMTVQVYKPTEQAIREGTVKVLPGRFEVVEGDGSSREVRLSVSSQNPGREFLITRSSNGQMPLNAIAFKDRTVSTNQGKLICANDGKYTVINYADPLDRNPIVVNGRTLAKNESCSLNDNDQMAIGSVKLVYHQV